MMLHERRFNLHFNVKYRKPIYLYTAAYTMLISKALRYRIYQQGTTEICHPITMIAVVDNSDLSH